MGSGNMLASGVGVEILNDDQDTISINNADSVVYPLKAGRNTLSFYIRYKSTRPTVTSGNATAVMYFDMQYE
ncbi:fimbrial protein, partial [Salmonella enterica]|nr:fimbrial protein [Salmonella enterica subsp. enterica serovar Typhimurium]MBJ6064255.1 fimbrial protein [Salmonella enterica subsp. enterica serovar Derby]